MMIFFLRAFNASHSVHVHTTHLIHLVMEALLLNLAYNTTELFLNLPTIKHTKDYLELFHQSSEIENIPIFRN